MATRSLSDLSESDIVTIWNLWKGGASLAAIGRRYDFYPASNVTRAHVLCARPKHFTDTRQVQGDSRFDKVSHQYATLKLPRSTD